MPMERHATTTAASNSARTASQTENTFEREGAAGQDRGTEARRGIVAAPPPWAKRASSHAMLGLDWRTSEGSGAFSVPVVRTGTSIGSTGAIGIGCC